MTKKTINAPLFEGSTTLFAKTQIEWNNQVGNLPRELEPYVSRGSWSHFKQETDKILAEVNDEVSRPLRTFRITGTLGFVVTVAALVGLGIMMSVNRDSFSIGAMVDIAWGGTFVLVVVMFMISQITRKSVKSSVEKMNDRFKAYFRNNMNGQGKDFYLLPDHNIDVQSPFIKCKYKVRIDVEEEANVIDLETPDFS